MAKLDITFEKGLLNGYDEKSLLEGGLFRASGVMFLPNDPNQLYKNPGRGNVCQMSPTFLLTALDTNEHSFAVIRYVGSTNPIAVYADPLSGQLRTAELALSSGSLDRLSGTNLNRGVFTNSTSSVFDWLSGLVKAVPTGDNRWVLFNGDPNSRPVVRDKRGKWYYLGLNKPSGTISDPALSSGLTGTVRPSEASSYAASGTAAYPYLSESDMGSETFIHEVLVLPLTAWNYDIGSNAGDLTGTDPAIVWALDAYLANTTEQQLSAAFGVYPLNEYWDRFVVSAFTSLSSAWDSSLETYAQVSFPVRPSDLEPNTPDKEEWQLFRAGARWLEYKGKTNGTWEDTKYTGKKMKRWDGHWWAVRDRADINKHKHFRVATATWKFTAGGAATTHTLYVTFGSEFQQQKQDATTRSKVFWHVSTDSGSTWSTVGSALVPVSEQTTLTYSVPSGTNFNAIRVKATLIVRKVNVSSQVDVSVYDIRIDAGDAAFAAEGDFTYAISEAWRYTDPDGRVFEMESEPSNTLSTSIAAGTATNATITLPAAPANTSAHGITSSVDYKHFYKIYRSTSTGGWPDLGYIASGHISGGTFTDAFELDGSTLGSPPLPLVYLGLAAYPACVKPPNFKDACLFRGSLVAIPANDPTKIIWSVPGRPYAFPVPYSLKVMPDNRNDELVGVATVNDALVLFGKNRVLRLLNLPFTANPNYEENRVSVDTISLTEGIQHPFNYCLAYLEDGSHVIAFVSRNGIYATDGSVAGEGGSGLKKLTPHIDWDGMVETSRLSRARLFYDPNTQTIHFDYDPKDYADGVRF